MMSTGENRASEMRVASSPDPHRGNRRPEVHRSGRIAQPLFSAAAGVSAVPDSARVCQMVGAREDPSNFLIMHAMAPNVAGVIGSAVGAGILLATFG